MTESQTIHDLSDEDFVLYHALKTDWVLRERRYRRDPTVFNEKKTSKSYRRLKSYMSAKEILPSPDLFF